MRFLPENESCGDLLRSHYL
jgi:hypothetical protein